MKGPFIEVSPKLVQQKNEEYRGAVDRSHIYREQRATGLVTPLTMMSETALASEISDINSAMRSLTHRKRELERELMKRDKTAPATLNTHPVSEEEAW